MTISPEALVLIGVAEAAACLGLAALVHYCARRDE